MKTLFLIRHAKSDWAIIGQPDFERGLSERGRTSLKQIAKYFQKQQIFPDRVLSSPAKRAKITAEKICKAIGFSLEQITFAPEIYESHMSGYEGALSIVMQQENHIENLFFVGHNNAITQLAEYLLGKTIGNIPTSGVVILQFDIQNWKDISYHTATLREFIKPKEL